jgi:hypothetical protein
MKKLNTLLLGVLVIIVIIITVIWLLPEKEVTGAAISTETPNVALSCSNLDNDEFYRACQQWNAVDYGTHRPPKLDTFSDKTAKIICDKLEKAAC